MDTTPFTVGFEVEAVVLRRSVRDALRAVGRPVVEQVQGDVFTFVRKKICEVGREANVYIPGPTGNKPDYSKWNIKDNSIETSTSSMEDSPVNKTVTRVGIEIVSPIFCIDDSSWMDEVDIVLTKLNDLHWKPNRSTGLHVHVGIEEREFTLDEVKAIAKYVITFEG